MIPQGTVIQAFSESLYLFRYTCTYNTCNIPVLLRNKMEMCIGYDRRILVANVSITFTLEGIFKVSKGAKIRNRYNQVPYLKLTICHHKREPIGQLFPSR